MADKPIQSPLPANLPENWTVGQIVAPAGADVGLSQQHGYNYLMEQVNAAQEAVNTMNDAFSDLATTEDLENVAATAQYTQVTLTAAGWSDNSQTVSVPGVVASETAQEITPIPAMASQEAYYQAEIQATAQGDGTLTFTCGDVPGSDLTVYVVVMEVEVAS